MNTKNEKKLFINGVNSYLDNVLYSFDKIPKESECNIQIQQIIELVECNNDLIVVKMTRKIKTEQFLDPFLTVSGIGEFHLTKDTIHNFKDLSEMESYAKTKVNYHVDKINMGSNLSQLIANITGMFGNIPIILPAIMNEEL